MPSREVGFQRPVQIPPVVTVNYPERLEISVEYAVSQVYDNTHRKISRFLIVIHRLVDGKISVGDFVTQKERAAAVRIVLR
jgi:hypothetical protein